MTLPQNVADAMNQLRDLAEAGDWLTSEDVEAEKLIRAHLMNQEAEIDELVRALTMCTDRAKLAESRLAAANALTVEWRDLVLNHNAGCAEMCDPDRCKYRPYLEANGRRCPECPVNDMIEIPSHLQGAGDEA